jgi:ribosomal protein S18 acetylase RimI-like enzyme
VIPDLRTATLEDAELIAQLTRACWVGKPENSSGHRETAAAVRASLEEGEIVIMELNGTAVGSVRLYPVFETDERGERFGPMALEIARLGILPELRGRGLSTWLMNEAMLRAMRHGIEELRLAVRTDEPGLKAFYERQGFVEDSSFTYSHANPNSPKPVTMRKYLFSRRPGMPGDEII